MSEQLAADWGVRRHEWIDVQRLVWAGKGTTLFTLHNEDDSDSSEAKGPCCYAFEMCVSVSSATW